MAYSDYGAFVYFNGERRRDKEDVAAFASYEETFGTSEDIPSGARIWASLLQGEGKERTWLDSIHHGIMGDRNIRVVCHKQGRPEIYEATENGFESITYCNEDEVDYYEYGVINFEYKGYKFHFESGYDNDRPYYARMETPEGDEWECEYDYEFGAGWTD